MLIKNEFKSRKQKHRPEARKHRRDKIAELQHYCMRCGGILLR